MELKYQQENAASRLHRIDTDALCSNLIRQARRDEAGQGGALTDVSLSQNLQSIELHFIINKMDDTHPSTLLPPYTRSALQILSKFSERDVSE